MRCVHSLIDSIEKNVLIADSNPISLSDMVKQFRSYRLPAHLYFAKNGIEVIRFIQRTGAYVKQPRPSLIILNANLSGIDPMVVIRRVKSDVALRAIPLVLVGSSLTQTQTERAYALQANSVVDLPANEIKLIRHLTEILSYWLSIARL